jgi:hypothetical protein
MKPGATTWPPTSITRVAVPSSAWPIAATRSPRIATSPRYQGLPVPSTMRAFLSSRSYGSWAERGVAAGAPAQRSARVQRIAGSQRWVLMSCSPARVVGRPWNE